LRILERLKARTIRSPAKMTNEKLNDFFEALQGSKMSLCQRKEAMDTISKAKRNSFFVTLAKRPLLYPPASKAK